jgi:hypothetical protein
MVLLANTSGGVEDAMRLASEKKASVWCGAEAVSEAQYQTGSYPGLSRFIHPLQGANADPIARAMDTSGEHHPRETVWVEGTVRRSSPLWMSPYNRSVDSDTLKGPHGVVGSPSR